MHTPMEDPEIPLVGMNGGYPLYTTSSEVTLDRKSSRFLNVGYRLARRKVLFTRRRQCCDGALSLSLTGIFLMIIETELVAAHVIEQHEVFSYLMRGVISLTTCGLIVMLGLYHKYDISIFTLDNSTEDWSVAITRFRVFKISVEFLVCVIHPFPQNIYVSWSSSSGEWMRQETFLVPLDTILSLPMFLRLYLVWRSIMLHSRLFTDASSQSLGALNQIPFNFSFVFKSLMALHADYVLISVMISVFLVASWSLRVCELQVVDEERGNFLNAMWLIAITFLSVGYGDVVPHSHCGRVISVLTGMMGAGCTALVVAVLARKLELSRSEKYIHDFVIDVDLEKRRKHAAANVLKAGWMIYKRQKVHASQRDVRRYKRKLLQAIHNMREIRSSQRRLLDGTVTLIELNKGQYRMNKDVVAINQKQMDLETQVTNISDQLMAMHNKIDTICAGLK